MHSERCVRVYVTVFCVGAERIQIETVARHVAELAQRNVHNIQNDAANIKKPNTSLMAILLVTFVKRETRLIDELHLSLANVL